VSKAFRTIVQIGAVVAGIALAIPSGGTSLLAAKLGISSLAASAIAVGLSVGAALLSRPAGLSGNRSAVAAQLQLGEQPRQAIFGRAAVGGTLVDAFNYGGKYGTDWEVMVIALADHRCDALEGFYVDDTFVAYTGDGDVPGFNSQLRVFWRAGTWGQEVPWILTNHGPGWTADDRAWGIAYAVIAYKADDEKAKNPIWTGGRPRFRWVVRGLRCYDPRKDSTAGGSGSHRWTNPETWEWTENPIVIRYNWVRGIYAGDQVNDPAMLLIGRGLSELEAPPQNVFARANLCDELVDGQPRYRIGGLVASNEPFIAVESDFAAAVGGIISQPEGAVEVDPGQAKAPIAHFTDDDIIVGSTVSWNRAILGQQDDGWVNTVAVRFTDPEQRWNVRSAPVRRENVDIIADRGPREQQPQLDFVNNLPQAQRLAEIVRRFGRLWGRAEVTLPPRFAFIEEGDWVTWQSNRRFGGATRTFRVEAWGSDRAWHHKLTLRQISASVFSDTDPLDDGVIAGNRPAPPVVAAPAPNAWSAAAVTLEGDGLSVSAIRVTGAADDPAAQFVVFEYVQQIEPPGLATVWTFASNSRSDVTLLDIPLVAGGRFFVAVSYVVDGVLGPRAVLGPVDIGPITYPDGTPVDALQPSEPGATEGAVIPLPGSAVIGNIRDDLGRRYDPGELLNVSLELTPAGRLQYRPLPGEPAVNLGRLALPDLGAASEVAIRRADADVERLAAAMAIALGEASETRTTFTDAGFYSDPATGQVRIHAIEQTRERVSSAEIRLNAAEAQINLRATVNYVDEAIANAVLDPGQIADLNTVFVRLTAAEVDIDGLQATVTTLATAAQLSLIEGRVTTAESAINALEGLITTKVESTTFNALESRVTNAENTLTAIGDTASIINAVRSVRLVERDQDGNAESDLRALLQGDRTRRDQVAAIAEARQEITARLLQGDAAEAAQRLGLAVRVGQAEAAIASESIVRANAVSALSAQINTLSTSVAGNTATLVTFGESINGLRARHGVRLDVNGRITGFVQNNDGTQGDFIVVADNFRVVDPDTGAAFIDADESGLRLRNGRVIMDNGAYIKATGVGFGTSGQFIEWFGPRPAGGDLALCTEAAALSYLKTNGDAYFGGSLSAGVIRNAARSTDIGAGASITIGPFGTNGNPILVVTSYSALSQDVATYPATSQGLAEWNAAVSAWGATPGLTVSASKTISCNVAVRVDRAVGNGSPAQWATLTITGGTETLTGQAPTPGDQEGNLTYLRTVSGSITSTDNGGGTQNRTFTATITNRTDAVLGTIESQIVALTATEE
jgi:hypothetical protein